MNYYSFHIGDYRRDTTHLSMLEHGVYRQLLDWLYLDEKPIPRETQVVMRRLSARTDEEKKAVLTVLEEMFILQEDGENGEGGYVQTRALLEINDYKINAEQSRKNGKLGGRPKKTQLVSKNNPGVSKNNPDLTQTKANQEPLTNNHIKEVKEKKMPVSVLSSTLQKEFDQFWEKYPKHESQLASQKAWKKHKPPLGKVLAALEWQTQQDNWQSDDLQYVPKANNYLREERWNDPMPTSMNSSDKPVFASN